MTARRVATPIVLLALAASASAQNLDDILNRYIAARGGLDRLRAVQTIRMSGTMSGGAGEATPVVIELKRPAMMRMDLTVDGAVGSQAFDGTSGWVLMPFAGISRAEPMPPDVAKDAHEQADFDGPLVDYAQKGHRAELTGRTRMDGRNTYIVKLTLKNGETREIYLDTETCLEVASKGTRAVRGRAIESETHASDYRVVNGLMFPFLMETRVAGSPERQRMALTKIDVNVPIDDARFQMPAAVKTPER